MTSLHPRPGVLEAAFWCWVAAAVLLVVFGIVVTATDYIPVLFRCGGAVLAVGGAALGYLAVRTRQGDRRFRRATLLLTVGMAVLAALYAIVMMGLVWPLVVLILAAAALCATRQAAQDWFDAADQPPGGTGG